MQSPGGKKVPNQLDLAALCLLSQHNRHHPTSGPISLIPLPVSLRLVIDRNIETEGLCSLVLRPIPWILSKTTKTYSFGLPILFLSSLRLRPSLAPRFLLP